MGRVPQASERPHWPVYIPGKQRQLLEGAELAQREQEMGAYYSARYALGRRFQLLKEFIGIPRGTGCVVVAGGYPPRIRWDKWAERGFGASEHEFDVWAALDDVLVTVE